MLLENINSSLSKGNRTYRRSMHFDGLIGFLFPEMKNDLSTNDNKMLVDGRVVAMLAPIVITEPFGVRILLVIVHFRAKGVQYGATRTVNVYASILVRLGIMTTKVGIDPGNKMARPCLPHPAGSDKYAIVSMQMKAIATAAVVAPAASHFFNSASRSTIPFHIRAPLCQRRWSRAPIYGNCGHSTARLRRRAACRPLTKLCFSGVGWGVVCTMLGWTWSPITRLHLICRE